LIFQFDLFFLKQKERRIFEVKQLLKILIFAKKIFVKSSNYLQWWFFKFWQPCDLQCDE